MTAVQFNGHFTVTYPDHLDASTGKTLTAVPGQSYTVTVAPGRNAGLQSPPGDGRWGTACGAAVLKPHAPGVPAFPVPPPQVPAPAQDGPAPETTTAATEAAAPESEA
jgi:hypothetical protein